MLSSEASRTNKIYHLGWKKNRYMIMFHRLINPLLHLMSYWYSMRLVLNGMAQCQKVCVNREQPWEGIKHAEDKNKEQQLRDTRKEVLKRYADMTIFAIGPARLVPTMCHHKLPTTIVILPTLINFWYLILSLMVKMHAGCSCSPHNVLHSPSIVTLTITRQDVGLSISCRPSLGTILVTIRL